MFLVKWKYIRPPANPLQIPYKTLLLKQGMVVISQPKILTECFDSGAGESGMELCLYSSSMGQESPVKIQHAQEATELTGGLRRRAVLQMCHSFLQWSGALDRYLVTEEDYLGCSEDTLRWVNEDPVCLKTPEENP
jgi:hypothetical protein